MKVSLNNFRPCFKGFTDVTVDRYQLPVGEDSDLELNTLTVKLNDKGKNDLASFAPVLLATDAKDGILNIRHLKLPANFDYRYPQGVDILELNDSELLVDAPDVQGSDYSVKNDFAKMYFLNVVSDLLRRINQTKSIVNTVYFVDSANKTLETMEMVFHDDAFDADTFVKRTTNLNNNSNEMNAVRDVSNAVMDVISKNIK